MSQSKKVITKELVPSCISTSTPNIKTKNRLTHIPQNKYNFQVKKLSQVGMEKQ